MLNEGRIFLGGSWVDADRPARIDVVSPATGKVIASVPQATPEEIDRAISSGQQAFRHGPWPRLPVAARAEHLRRVLANLEPRTAEAVTTLVRETGITLRRARLEASSIPGVFAELADAADLIQDVVSRPGAHGAVHVLREPRGVVALVPSWDSVLATIGRLFSALLMGCPVVVKLPTEAPQSLTALAAAFELADSVPGLVSFVPGGREAVERMVASPGIDMVSFAGSAELGRLVAAVCGRQVKPVTLELGGNSVALLAPGCDLARHLPTVIDNALAAAGQSRNATRRILVHESQVAEAADLLVCGIEAITIGDPLDEGTDVGPLQSGHRLAVVEDYIACGLYEGATLATGGKRPADLPVGYYLQPALFTMVENDMTIAREEVPGPVLCVIPYRTEDEAVALANSSRYGRSAGVYADDVDHGRKLAGRLSVGAVSVNDGAPGGADGPSEGRGLSGLGTVGSVEGMQAFSILKSISLPGRATPRRSGSG